MTPRTHRWTALRDHIRVPYSGKNFAVREYIRKRISPAVFGHKVFKRVHRRINETLQHALSPGGVSTRLLLSSTGLSLSRADDVYHSPGMTSAASASFFALSEGKITSINPKALIDPEETSMCANISANTQYDNESIYEKAVDFIRSSGLERYTHIPVNSSRIVDYYYIFNALLGRQSRCKQTALSPKCCDILDSILATWKLVKVDPVNNPVFNRPHLAEPHGLDVSIWDMDRHNDIQSDAGTYRFKLVHIGAGTEIHFWTITRWSVINDSDAVFAFISYDNESDLESLMRSLDAFSKADRIENRVITVCGGNDIEISSKMEWDDLVLPNYIVQSTKEDIEGWIAAESRYKKLHVPYRRGYLFEGPPGNGKTATARTIISTYGFRSFMFNFADARLGDAHLQEAFGDAAHEAPAVFLLEDIDRIFDPQTRTTAVTLSGLLNCLDGLATHDGVITIATANNPKVLDPAIRLRPGRFDVPVRFDNPSEALRVRYLNFVLERTEMSNVSPGCIAEVANKTDGMSMAFVKSLFESAAYISKGDISDSDLLDALNRTKRYYTVMEKSADRRAGFVSEDSGAATGTRPSFEKDRCSSGSREGKTDISFP